MEMQKQNQTLKTAVVVLSLLLVGSIFYIYDRGVLGKKEDTSNVPERNRNHGKCAWKRTS